jgi:hypothetical protein
VCFGELIPAFSGFFSWERDVEMLHRIFLGIFGGYKEGKGEKEREKEGDTLAMMGWFCRILYF